MSSPLIDIAAQMPKFTEMAKGTKKKKGVAWESV
jgi:hypothetical protein